MHLFLCIALRGNRLWKISYYISTDASLTHMHTETGVLGCAEDHKGILEHSSNVKDACCVYTHSVKPVKNQWKQAPVTVYTHNTFSHSILGDGDKLFFVGRLRNPPPVLCDTVSVKSKRRGTKEEEASIVRAPRALQWLSTGDTLLYNFGWKLLAFSFSRSLSPALWNSMTLLIQTCNIHNSL